MNRTLTVLTDYKQLIAKYLGGFLADREFSDVYVEKFKREKRGYSELLFTVLQILFSVVESFEEDADDLPQQTGIDRSFYANHKELQEAAVEAFGQLEALEAALVQKKL
jgi:hypothetical protein